MSSLSSEGGLLWEGKNLSRNSRLSRICESRIAGVGDLSSECSSDGGNRIEERPTIGMTYRLLSVKTNISL
ncbi:hypothetical protein PROFUN_02394 [Planoprotostelium fungivorum]|uniref:Uncharacterized protein n=1 Tax=Planoprotostelium fungivorum TaxID=1890364 RepID=A0A2P6NUP5_9EUKA|nr:hypothetical protein PROFUN_02394 [Planoprotostelium fungivorum]